MLVVFANLCKTQRVQQLATNKKIVVFQFTDVVAI